MKVFTVFGDNSIVEGESSGIFDHMVSNCCFVSCWEELTKHYNQELRINWNRWDPIRVSRKGRVTYF